jgi:predicted ABC-type ATPase
MPTLFILAGPNGAGKTTFYFNAIDNGYIWKGLPFINVDLIARNELGVTLKKILRTLLKLQGNE